MGPALFDLAPDSPATPKQPLAGIARLAASSASIGARRDVEYLSLPVRSILNRCGSGRMPFDYTINPYRGCEFGCRYCCARYTHQYMELDGGLFERRIYAKLGAADLLRAELRKIARAEIAIGTAGDPYQPAERGFGLTRRILEVIAETAEGLQFGLVTKSDLVTRDLDLFMEIGRRNSLDVSLTITTMRPELARALEPRAPRPDLRLAAVRRLAEAGIATGVFIAPVLPLITDHPADIEEIARRTAEAGGRHILANPLFLPPSAQKQFFPFLEKEFPRLVERYRKGYERGAFLRGEYPNRLTQLVERLREKYNLRAPSHDHPFNPAQPLLFQL
jgi:DNA repair photolyase